MDRIPKKFFYIKRNQPSSMSSFNDFLSSVFSVDTVDAVSMFCKPCLEDAAVDQCTYPLRSVEGTILQGKSCNDLVDLASRSEDERNQIIQEMASSRQMVLADMLM